MILAELNCRRAWDAGATAQVQGLQTQNTILTTWLNREITRGDKLAQIDTNSQKMDTNAVIIQTGLEKTVAEKNDKIADLNDKLRSCQNNQKWIAGVSGITGAVAGYLIRGKVGSLGGFTAAPQGIVRPMPLPQPDLNNILLRQK